MKPEIIRPLAICVFRHQDRILVAEGFDPVKRQHFYRPLGGMIEFGESSIATIHRELREELNVAVTGLRYLGTLENIFVFNGQAGHEIVMVYDGRFEDAALYERESLAGVEDDGASFRAIWLSLADCLDPDSPPLYPAGLLQLLTNPPSGDQ